VLRKGATGKTGDARIVKNYYFIHVMTAKEKLSRLTGINIVRLFDEVLKENEEDICNMNRTQMYEDGTLNVKNPGQTEKYSESTIKAKRKAPYNKTDFITLKWMGNFHESLKIIIFKDKFIISSGNKIWANYLEAQNRFKSALGLTEKNKKELRDLARDEMIRKIKNEL
jgi:hypothetical protein